MSSKLSILGLSMALVASVGCSSAWMSREEHELETAQLTEYKNALEKENAELRMKAAEFDRMKTESELSGDSAKFYADLAASLKKALSGMGVEQGDVFVNKNGAIEFKDGVLFSPGKWEISPKGKDLLRKLADSQKGNVLKVVGHTDKKPIVREATKKALETDTNMELSLRRALAVYGELLHDGMRETQFVSVEGHGMEATQSNGVARCVEIFVVKGTAVAPTNFQKAPVRKTSNH